MNAIADFIRPYKPLIDSHVVDFFKDKLWELVDEQWMECLRKESVENLLGIPSGIVQDYWPASLQEFILELRSLALPREQKSFHEILPNMHVTSLDTVLVQGMNLKKKHEVEILAAVVNAIAHEVDAHTIIDVGSGQGYLAQALSFEYHHSVIAIDASLHHSNVTAARAERIKKYYAAKLRGSGSEILDLKVPQVVTSHVLSSDMLTSLSTSLYKDNTEPVDSLGPVSEREGNSCENCHKGSSLVLAGLHACGDLSVSMLRSFADCEEVKAIVGIGCCYNMLSEEYFKNGSISYGFPMSTAARFVSLNLGKSARDLACQSAERWKNLTKDAALQNFELHAFRAAFQMLLDKTYPGVLTMSPSIGRQGKALRRRQFRRSFESRLGPAESDTTVTNFEENNLIKVNSKVQLTSGHHNDVIETIPNGFEGAENMCKTSSASKFLGDKEFKTSDKYDLFKEFCEVGLSRLNLGHLEDFDMHETWRDVRPSSELVGPYWSLRAAVGQLVETYILLDRLLFLQEGGDFVEACLFPIFNPIVSPRNIAILARKTSRAS